MSLQVPLEPYRVRLFLVSKDGQEDTLYTTWVNGNRAAQEVAHNMSPRFDVTDHVDTPCEFSVPHGDGAYVVEIVATKCPWHDSNCNMGMPCMGCHTVKYPNGVPA